MTEALTLMTTSAHRADAGSSTASDDMKMVKLEVDSEGVAIVTIDDPGRKVNITSPALVAELMAVLDRVAAAPTIKGAVITSGKVGTFVAGGDIKDFATAHDRGVTLQQAFEIANSWNVDLRRVETCGKPIAAAINGAALGGGLELALCCHYRVLIDDPKAVVGQPEVTLGLLPGGGGTQRLPRLIGIEKALPLLLEGRRLEPAEALALGIVDEVVPGEKLIDTARRWVRANPEPKQPWDTDGYAVPGGAGPLAPHANRTFETSTAQVMERTQGNYPAPLAILSAVYEGVALPIELGLRVEAQYFATLLTGPVARNLMRTLVLNRPRSEKLSGVCVERTRAALTDEVARLQNEGVAPALIENAARAAGMSVSSLTGTDGVSRLEPRAMVLPRADQPSIEEVKKRLLYIQALEGARCLEEGVVTHPADADLGAVLGAGFPSWTGGTLSFIETVGMRAFVAGCERMAECHGARFRPSAWLKARAERDERFYSLARASQ